MGQENGDTFSVFRKMSDGPAVAMHGQVFTLPHIVDLMLDLAGYTPDKPLCSLSLLEPGSGNGAFLTRAAVRLLASKPKHIPVQALSSCLLGVEKDPALVDRTRSDLAAMLVGTGMSKAKARSLAKGWVVCADFLNAPFNRPFDFIVGNPPYVRQEAIPKDALEHYRQRFSCFYDRADLYIAFFERSLELLSADGTLVLICPNRFTKNNYGRKLRQVVSEQFRLTHVVDLPEASPFEPAVLSYPGIYVVRQGKTEAVNHVLLHHATPAECDAACHALQSEEAVVHGPVAYHRYESWFSGEAKWATHSPHHLALLRHIEEHGVPLGSEASGCKVGIGIATGADDIFIVRREEVDVEAELLLPIVTTKDIASGQLQWQGKYLINPFQSDDSGRIISLDAYPKAKVYFERHQDRLTKRNIGKRHPQGWYRTIDRVHRKWTNTPMVLIPDIKGSNLTIALKGPGYYPHHNLYFVTSDYWDLRLLHAILRSNIARFFVFMYGVRMRHGYYRFQAQYLRRICLPSRMDVSPSLVKRIVAASEKEDTVKLNGLLARLYRLSPHDATLLHSFDESTQAGSSEEAG